jgi:hypothetical protein
MSTAADRAQAGAILAAVLVGLLDFVDTDPRAVVTDPAGDAPDRTQRYAAQTDRASSPVAALRFCTRRA